jgi:DNA repair protein
LANPPHIGTLRHANLMESNLKITPELQASIAEKRRRAEELLMARRSENTKIGSVLNGTTEPEVKDAGDIAIPEFCLQLLPETGETCGAPTDSLMASTFGEAVCSRCKFNHEDFEVVSKEVAKKDYMLTDFSLSTLKYLSKPNPHNASWSHIKLYLRKHLKDRAAVRWGSFENMTSRRRAREERKYEAAVKKVGDIFESKERVLAQKDNTDSDRVVPKRKKVRYAADVLVLAAIVRGDNNS